MDHIPSSSSPQDAPTLAVEHREELAASGLTETTIAAAGIRTARDGEIREILGWQPKTHRWGRGIVYAYRNLDGAQNGYRRVKLDDPRFQKGKPVKYESPLNAPNRAFFPPGFAEALKSKDRPILISEGEKKALALAQLGFAAIGLIGTWGWQQRRKRDDHGRAYGKRELIADLRAIDWNGRTVILIFDSDAADNRLIQLAEARLTKALTELGADVRVARIPADGANKIGVDDFLVARGDAGPAELRKLIEAAKPVELPSKWELIDWAKALVEDQFMRPGALTLRWWRDEFYRWGGKHYVKLETSELRACILAWLDKRDAKQITPRFAGDICGCLESLCRVAFTMESPCWLIEGRGGDRPDAGNIIAFSNGLLDISDVGGELKLLPHSPRWFATSSLPYAFDPAADCPQWRTFLDQVFDSDPERIDLLQRWFGLLLTADTSYQKLLLLIGPKRSGKGTVCRIIVHVFGEAACTSPSLTSLGGEFGLWQLVGKSIALFPDAHVGRSGDAMRIMETIKSIVGEDRLNVNRKNLPYLLGVRLRTRLVVTVNELPHFPDASGALAARLSILPFHNSYMGREDRGLEGKLKAEAAGILNWALRGLYRLRAEGGFNVPATAAAVADNYLRLSAPVAAFVAECCATGPGLSVEVGELFDCWKAWAEENGHKAISRPTFGERLRAPIPSIARSREREGEERHYVYHGVALNDDGQALLDAARAAAKGARHEG